MGADLKTCKTILFIAALLASCLSHATTTTITFDEFVLSGPPIQDGYANLRWDNFSPQKGSKHPLTGYANGVVSGQNVAFNGFGSPATISSDKAFDLFSGFFAAAWHNELAVKVVASGLNRHFSTSFIVNTTGPVKHNFNWTNINSVTFSSSGGVSAGLEHLGDGVQFTVDNLVMALPATAPIPEPETYVMMLSGWGLLAFLRRRRQHLSCQD